MPRRKHKPQRICIVCRQVQDKRNLIRVVRTPAGQVVLDPTGKANGRGLYLCRSPQCLAKGLKKERLAHTLKVPVSGETVEALRRALQTEISTQ